MRDHLFVITGGPGSGKSSLVEALSAQGFRHMPEAGRAIIQDQVGIGGDAVPWQNRAAFAELMLGWEMRSYREAMHSETPVIFDRGVPDVLGYLALCHLPAAAHMHKAAELYRYNRTVFITPHWPAIFTQDAERKQSAQEAAATCDVMRQTYGALGYRVVDVPLAPVAVRAAFVARVVAAGGLGD